MQEKTAEYGSDAIVDELRELGIEYVSLNPGATTRGIHDSVVNYGGNKKPELILCCHEGVAVAIASGYFRATRRPMVVLLHDIVGLMHATKAIFDAWLNRDAMILIGGNGPSDAEKRRPWIDWIHNALIPNSLVRDYVKWDDQPFEMTSALEDLVRARNIALTEPSGPVYISIDAGLQEERLGNLSTIPKPENFPLPFLGGSLEELQKSARLLAGAENPVIVLHDYGRSDQSVANLVELSEQLGTAVLDTGARFNFPSNHPLNVSGLEEEMLSKADVVLTLGVKDLFFHLAKRDGSFFSRASKLVVKPECKVIRVDMEGLTTNSWVTEYGRLTPSSKYIASPPPVAVETLLDLCRKEISESRNERRIRERSADIESRSRDLRRKWLDSAISTLNDKPLKYSAVALIAKELAEGSDWVLAFPGYSSRGMNSWLRRLWDIRRYYQYPGRGEGTGTGTGQALGVALANKGRLCIDFQPDGDLLYSASSLWTASHSRIPILVIMMNDRSYHNDEEHNRFISRERGRSEESSRIGIKIEDPGVDFSSLANSYGIGASGLVQDADGLRLALKNGISEVQSGKPYLVDVLSQFA